MREKNKNQNQLSCVQNQNSLSIDHSEAIHLHDLLLSVALQHTMTSRNPCHLHIRFLRLRRPKQMIGTLRKTKLDSKGDALPWHTEERFLYFCMEAIKKTVEAASLLLVGG